MIQKLCYVTCDVCGLPAGTADDMRDNPLDARRRAEQLGFTPVRVQPMGHVEDYCPAHKPQNEGA